MLSSATTICHTFSVGFPTVIHNYYGRQSLCVKYFHFSQKNHFQFNGAFFVSLFKIVICLCCFLKETSNFTLIYIDCLLGTQSLEKKDLLKLWLSE